MLTDNWNNIQATLTEAVSIAWDGCHKIYVLMDEEQHREMVSYGYDPLLRLEDIGPDRALATLKEWYEASCGLRFVNAVRTDADPMGCFTSLIGQFEDEELDDGEEDDE